MFKSPYNRKQIEDHLNVMGNPISVDDWIQKKEEHWKDIAVSYEEFDFALGMWIEYFRMLIDDVEMGNFYTGYNTADGQTALNNAFRFLTDLKEFITKNNYDKVRLVDDGSYLENKIFLSIHPFIPRLFVRVGDEYTSVGESSSSNQKVLNSIIDTYGVLFVQVPIPKSIDALLSTIIKHFDINILDFMDEGEWQDDWE